MMKHITRVCVAGALVMAGVWAFAEEPIDLGGRLEPMADDYLVERFEGGAELELHHPANQEVVLVHDAPWEGNTCAYHTVFQDEDKYRMYYRGSHHSPGDSATHQVVCYAESEDGIHWTKPNLDLVEFEGSKENNIIWDAIGSHNFAPFKDKNPEAARDAKYKAVGRGPGGLYPFKSEDAIHWELMSDEPVITEGDFDSQNIAFYDTERGEYLSFHRKSRDGVRDIMTCSSDDFLNWTQPVFLEYPDAPKEHLYTNQITPYPRAPHIYMGFPKRFVPGRDSPAGHAMPGVSDGVFMTSRDGHGFSRWGEAFLRPGPQRERWVNRNNMIAWGIVNTASAMDGAPDELSIYSTEDYYQGEACLLRRHTLRMDGFVSVNAPLAGGEIVTKPLTFEGGKLAINFASSAAGSVRVEMQEADGTPIEGYALTDCPAIYGDSIERIIEWESGSDVSDLAGKAVRLRFELKDADLYALQFK
ncbi:MAG: hypothetical protein ACLFV4_02780 [Candidatus Hydrogenedentota bacterium]